MTTSDERRQDRAQFLARSANQWIKCRREGRPFAFGIPSASQPGLYHLTTLRACDCQDHKRGNLCKHIRACRIHVEKCRAERAAEGKAS